MPCTYFESPEEQRASQDLIVNKKVEERTIELKAKLDEATRAACELSSLLKEIGVPLRNPFLKKWIKEHEAMDALRKK